MLGVRLLGWRSQMVMKAWLMGVLLAMFAVVLPVKAQTAPTEVFLDSLSSCNPGRDYAPSVSTGIGPVRMTYPYQDPVAENNTPACDGNWKFQGAAYLVAPAGSGTVFPDGATQAIWLNEAFTDNNYGQRTRGEMTRVVSGLQVGRIYRVSAQAWHDDSPGRTFLGLDFGTAIPERIPVEDGNQVFNISATVCAFAADNLTIRLYEDGRGQTGGASPVVTNIKLESMNQPCQFVVEFVTNSPATVPKQDVLYDEKAKEPDPLSQSGFGFAGWFLDSALTQPYDFNTPVQKDIKLYAKWVPDAYYVSGIVQGLAAGNTLTLTNSNGDQLLVQADGRFRFTQTLAGSGSYAVGIPNQPDKQECAVTQAPSGPMNNADVSNVLVECKGPYTVTYNALGGSAVDPETVGPGVSARRPTDPALTGSVFSGWFTDPAGTQAYNFSTPVNADITLYAKWSNTYTVGGSVTGLMAGQTLGLENQNGVSLSITADGNFEFWTRVVNQGPYAVVISSQPSGQTCEVTQGSGTIDAANVTNVLVTCVTNPVVVPGAATPVPATSPLVLWMLAAGLGLLGVRRFPRHS